MFPIAVHGPEAVSPVTVAVELMFPSAVHADDTTPRFAIACAVVCTSAADCTAGTTSVPVSAAADGNPLIFASAMMA